MVNQDQFKLVLCSILLVYLPYKAFDRIPILLLTGIEAGIFLLGILWISRYRQQLWVLLAMILISGIAGETYIRIAYFGLHGLDAKNYCPADYGHSWSTFHRSAETYTGIAPNSRNIFKGGIFTTNQFGFRGMDYTYDKPKNVFRIVVVGASATTGAGVDDESRFVSIIEKKLNATDLAIQVEVIDLSIPGSSLGNRIHVIENVGLKFNPDMILFRLNPPQKRVGPLIVKQRKMAPYHLPISDLLLKPEHHFFSQRFFLARLLWQKSKDNILPFGIEIPMAAKARSIKSKTSAGPISNPTVTQETALVNPHASLVETLVQLSETKRNTRIVLFLLRPLGHLNDKDHHSKHRAGMKKLAKRFNFDLIDTYYTNFGGYQKKDLIIYPGDHHPNAIAHRLFGEYMAAQLEDLILESAKNSKIGQNQLFRDSHYNKSP